MSERLPMRCATPSGPSMCRWPVQPANRDAGTVTW